MPLGGPSAPSFHSHYFDIINLFSFDRSIDRSIDRLLLLLLFERGTVQVQVQVQVSPRKCVSKTKTLSFAIHDVCFGQSCTSNMN
jgi:hypothetical protein